MTRRRLRNSLPPMWALVFTLLVLVAAPASAADADDPTGTQQFQVSTTSGPPGTVIYVTGSCAAKAEASLYYLGSEFYRVDVDLATDSSGGASGQLRVPSQAPGGEYGIVVSCANLDVPRGSSEYPFTVTEAGPPPGPSVTDITIGNWSESDSIDTAGLCRLFGSERAGAELEVLVWGSETPTSILKKVLEPRADGRFAGSVTVPGGHRSEDRVDVVVRCLLDGAYFGQESKTFRQEQMASTPSPAPPTLPAAPGLPDTGAPGPRTLGPIALAMVAAGFALVFAARRRPDR